ncbi:MAG: type II secretion system protein [Phycisphaeraceae bacterium]|nr:type II secretion system protein [Phycisphaeraceae bacterium]
MCTRKTRLIRGFSLIELVVVIGIVMILIGLMAPSLGRAMSQAKLTRDVALVRQHAATIAMYAGDYKEAHPYPYDLTGHLYRVAGDWALPMIESGHFENVAEVDPYTLDGRLFSYMMSIAMVYNADEMRPGYVPLAIHQKSNTTRAFQVLFPSSKGLLVRESNGLAPSEGGTGFCCAWPWIAPIAFSDGSAGSGTYVDFNEEMPLLLDEGIGMPVISTWFGVRGRDR